MSEGGGGRTEKLLGSKKAIGNGLLEMSNATAYGKRYRSGHAGLWQLWEITTFRNTMVTLKRRISKITSLFLCTPDDARAPVTAWTGLRQALLRNTARSIPPPTAKPTDSKPTESEQARSSGRQMPPVKGHLYRWNGGRKRGRNRRRLSKDNCSQKTTRLFYLRGVRNEVNTCTLKLPPEIHFLSLTSITILCNT